MPFKSRSFENARIAEVRRRYRWHGKQHRSPHSTPRQIANLRISDLSKLYNARYGGPLPDDDAGRDDMMLALHHLIGLPQGIRRCQHWLNVWAPWLTLEQTKELIAEATMSTRAYTADQLAWRLGLTMADRTELAITTIGAVDCNKRERTRLRKAKAKERERQRRMRIKAACAP